MLVDLGQNQIKSSERTLFNSPPRAHPPAPANPRATIPTDASALKPPSAMPDKGKQPGSANLAERRTAWVFLRALLWKNWLIKRRHPVATACEVLVPVVFIILLGVLKSTTTTVAVPSGWSDTTASAGDAAVGTSYNLFQPTGQTIEWVSADLPKFALHESTMTGLILKLGVQSVDDAIRLEELSTADQATCTAGVIVNGLVETNTSSPYSVPSECADKVAPYKIGIAPENAFTRDYFAAAMDMWYPRLELTNSSSDAFTVPSFSESVRFFGTNDELTEYVKSDEYGKGIENPRIYAAIVFDSVPLGSDIGGNATYRGMSINEDMDELRQSLGICFQHDVLFPDLTVEEHLFFFGQIKGYAHEELVAVAEKQISEVGLTEKRNSKPNDLSGGMKRKLSVAVSLLGDSSLVFLDEPTSGMDPYSRRSTWEILLNNRNDRVMVLTTHFMDEADILGDRIAIMAEGELRCCGSSLFLKNRFGAGYNLTLVKDDATCDDNDVSAFVTSFVPSAQLLSNVGSEIAFQLPLHSSSSFAAMFAELDRQLQTLV
ncbi:unnamed protein product [Phytophthora fragariaefolia]|uniref:Unnamed protein product n=1 Tax=Phytophthora fragariaefolia TaxID=1490495 RepID=A0A9W7D7Q8_9STRA|nr:unnamed protein product [Phytophthora fragariaefolia]